MNNDKLIINNIKVSVNINMSSLSGVIENKVSGDAWGFDVLKNLRYRNKGEENYSYDVEIKECSEISTGMGGVKAIANIGNQRFQIKIWIERDQPDVVFDIEARDSILTPVEILCFPGPILPLGDSIKEFILPKLATQGISHKPKFEEHWHMEFPVWQGLNMPMWGLFNSRGGALTIVNTPDDCGMIIAKHYRGALMVD